MATTVLTQPPTQAITDSVIDNQQFATAPPAVLPATPPVGAAPDVSQDNFKETVVPGVNVDQQKGSDGYITDNALIEKRLEALWAKDNPLLKQARLQSDQVMNASGVAHSSRANQLGTQAMIAKGLDIVTPDADTYARGDLNLQTTEYQGALNKQQATNQGQLANQTGFIDYGATNQQGNISAWLNKQGQGYALDQASFNAAIASASAQQAAWITASQKEAEMRFNESIQEKNLNAEMLQTISGIYATSSASYITNVSEVMNNPDLDDAGKKAWIAQLQTNFYTHMENMATMAGVSLTFK